MTRPAPQDPNSVSRRSLLQLSGLAGGALFTGGIQSLLAGRAQGQFTLRQPVPHPDLHIRVHARNGQAIILPGPRTTVMRYDVDLLAGSPQHLQSIPLSYLGPVVRMHRGQRLAVDLENELFEDTIIHWHGLDVPEDMDGHPLYAVGPGASYRYEFPVINRAGTYHFHPHPHMRTGPQLNAGLAGMIIVSDDEEAALDLPRGSYEIPLVLQDRRFRSGNQLDYVADAVAGFLGNRMLVNGLPDYVLNVATRVYRLRVLNGSNSRVYKLGWSDGTPMTVLGCDGGLLAAPVVKPYVMLGPGERVDLWADFSTRTVGSNVFLRSLPYTVAGPTGGQTPINGAQLDLMEVRVVTAETETRTLPAWLSSYTTYDVNQAVNLGSPRTYPITIGAGGWLLNGATFDMLSVAPNEYVQRGDLEVWRFTNTSGAGQMIHPIHIHGGQFQVYSRTMNAAGAANYETVRYGLIDEGWKDTFLVMPGETVEILIKFTHYAGLFLYHCHNIEHEDMGMMRNFQVLP